MSSKTVKEIKAEEKARRCALAKCPLAGQGDPRCAECTGPVTWMENGRQRRGANGAHRSCTSCPMNGKGLPVCLAGCPGPREDFASDGESMVTLGGMPDPEKYLATFEAYDAKLARRPSADFVTSLPAETETAMLALLRVFANLSQSQVLTLHAMLTQTTQTGAAKSLGVTKQAVSHCIRRMVKHNPELANFFYPANAER